MKERISIAVVLLVVVVVYFCLIVHARGQAFTPRRPFILQSASTGGSTNQEPYNLSGLYLWWHSDDFLSYQTNGSIACWTDRIQGWIFTNETSGSRPTISGTNGVAFDGTAQFMTNVTAVNMSGDSGHSLIFVVMQWIPSGITPVYMSYTDGTSWQDRRLQSSDHNWAINYGPPSTGCNIVHVPTNELMTLSTLNYTGGERAYTNGVYANASCGGFQKFNWIGFTPSFWYFKGYIRDIICYTNQSDPTFVTNLQYWAYTNYGVPYYP